MYRNVTEETQMNDDLTALGDAIERAVALDIASSRNISLVNRHVPTDHRNVIEEEPMPANHSTHDVQPSRAHRRSRRVVAISALAVLGIGGAAAAAVSTMSSDEVSHGLPGG